jgi:hypothetical protein
MPPQLKLCQFYHVRDRRSAALSVTSDRSGVRGRRREPCPLRSDEIAHFLSPALSGSRLDHGVCQDKNGLQTGITMGAYAQP